MLDIPGTSSGISPMIWVLTEHYHFRRNYFELIWSFFSQVSHPPLNLLDFYAIYMNLPKNNWEQERIARLNPRNRKEQQDSIEREKKIR